MSSCQGESGAVVVEGSELDGLPPGFGVALLTAGPQPASMRILMTVGTRRVPNVGEPNVPWIVWSAPVSGLPLMAAIAGDRSVLPHQGESSRTVIERCHRLPALDSMTGLTRSVCELATVLIPMTALTATAIETQKRVVEPLVPGFETVRVADQCGFVTASALEAPVGPCEHVSGLPMIEGPLAVVAPEDQLELFAVVFHVATFATLIGYGGVIASTPLQPLSEDLVAVEAAFRCDPLSLAVAV